MSAHLKRLSAARTALVLDHPFFGALALRLTLTETDSVTNTMATDGRAIFYAPAFVDTLNDQELVALLAHEVMHPAMQHHARRLHRDAKRWNDAADYAINPVLTEAGFAIPADGLNDPQYAGLSAEQIYDRLPQPEPDDKGGSGSDVRDTPGAVLDAPGDDVAADAADWQVAVSQAMSVARMMGRLPASMARAVGEMTRPRVDWRALLRRFVQQCASADYSWKMPNRRYLASGLYLPELRSDAMPALVVAVDTSGSIGETVLSAFHAEITSIVDECAPESVHVVYCDAEVQRVDTFARGEPVEMHASGGGGTDFCPVFAHVDAEQLQPACIVYLTDGCGTYPEVPSDVPTLWVMTTDCVAPWGETVRIDS